MARARGTKAGFRGGFGGKGFAGSIGGKGQLGRGGGAPGRAQVVMSFNKAGAFVTGDFLGEAKVGDLGRDTTSPDLWQCTNATTAAWEKVGLQT